MYELDVPNKIRNSVEELIKVYLMPNEYSLTETDFEVKDKQAFKRQVFDELSILKGYRNPWGIMTGVKPVKLTRELFNKLNNDEALVRNALKEEYYLSQDKIDLIVDTCKYQIDVLDKCQNKTVGVYIGIPFCPTRCLYCSFTSNQKPESEIIKYLDALKKEIRYVGTRMKETGLKPESIYIGGGTPTTLNENLLDELLTEIEHCFDFSCLKEFTVEAGRPDTITIEKLAVIKKHNIHRISINPQSMKDETLKLIGRAHSSQDILNAFYLAKEMNINIINCDLICGLPKETNDDFNNTLDTIFNLDPKNITIHTLAVKRASKLIEEDPTYNYKEQEIVKEMLNTAYFRLKEKGYRPYYLYRLKNMAGSLENVGWSKDNTPCIYNIRIMDEQQSILALGAGGVSKIYFEKENRIERISNVSNYEVYIDRIDEMINRKEIQFFREVKNAY